MSKKKYQNCTICNAVFINEQSIKCHSCNLIRSQNQQHAICTAHLTKEDKEKISQFILDKKGVLFKFYNQAPHFIMKEFGIDLDFKGVRSIISSEYYKSIAFD